MILITNKLRCCCFKNFTGDHCPELHHLHCFFWPFWTTIEEINPTIFFLMSSKVKLTSFFYRNNITGDHCVQNDHLLMWKILSTTTLSSSFSLVIRVNSGVPVSLFG
ncbi:unnamed protein product [Lathyrus oleraceus]